MKLIFDPSISINGSNAEYLVSEYGTYVSLWFLDLVSNCRRPNDTHFDGFACMVTTEEI